MLWCIKHAPKNLDGIAGNETVVSEAKRWGIEWNRGKRERPLLLCGPAGVGKTALAYALAASMGWNVVETNASDLRNKDAVQRVAGLAAAGETLFGDRRLILVDEADGLQSADRGGAGAVAAMLRGATQPVVLTANDLWAPALAYIRALCRPLEMRRLNARSIEAVLHRIAHGEGIEAEPDALALIAKRCEGDLRSAINDLQASAEGLKSLTAEHVVAGERNRQKSIFDAMKAVFKSGTYAEARAALEGVDEQPEFVMRWVEENIPHEYEKPEDIADAFNALSKGDVFMGRITRRQHWGFLKYAIDLSTAGVALAKREPYRKFVKYNFPSIIRRYSATKERRAMQKALGRLIGRRCHVSSKDAQLYLPMLKALFAKKGSAVALSRYFAFEAEEIAFVMGAAAKEKKVMEIVEAL